MKLKSALLVALATLPAQASAQAYQCRIPQQIKPVTPSRPDGPARQTPVGWYILAASWSPDYCKMNGDRASMQCSGRQGRFGFILHGLWPEARSGPPPQWCSVTPSPAPRLLRRHMCMTPSARLLVHEWAKHGSCMVRKPETYFKVSAILWRSIRWPDADYLSRKEGLTAGEFRKAFIRLNPAWKANQVGIETSRTGWLKGVRLCYGLNFMPRNCPRRALGRADIEHLQIWRGL